MKLVFLEPLGIPGEKLETMAKETIKERMEVVFYPTRVEDVPTLIERSKDADVVVLSNFKYPEEVIRCCPKLKMICVAFTGVDHVAMDYCKAHDIMVCNCSGYATVAVAELVFGLTLDLYRRIGACDKVVREGGTKAGLVGFELEGKKFGIVGAGAIGLKTAAIARAFGCEVYAFNRSPKEIEGITFTDLETLLKTCDIISLHTPLTPQTKGLIGKEQIAMMKPNAVLINTARGPVVDSQALADALNQGIIAGAGVDVFEVEPPVPTDHPLFAAKNLVATPHVAFASAESMQKRAVMVMDNIVKWLEGTPQNIM